MDSESFSPSNFILFFPLSTTSHTSTCAVRQWHTINILGLLIPINLRSLFKCVWYGQFFCFQKFGTIFFQPFSAPRAHNRYLNDGIPPLTMSSVALWFHWMADTLISSLCAYSSLNLSPCSRLKSVVLPDARSPLQSKWCHLRDFPSIPLTVVHALTNGSFESRKTTRN